ncbi:MAG: hypothetical protein COC10_10280, partial [Sphingobium sp.]
ASRWVEAEIALFRELHPDRPVIAALVEGEPADSFPAALLARDPDGAVHEPIAAASGRTSAANQGTQRLRQIWQ